MVSAARCCSTGSGRSINLNLNLDLLISGPRVLLFHHPYAGARALLARPWSAGCYGVARQREGSRQNGIGGSGVLPLRHFGLVLFIPWRVGAEEAGAAKDAIMASAAPSASPRPDRNGAMLLDRLGPPEFRFIDFRAPRLPYLSPLARARALLPRPWFARCYGVARQREGSRQNSIGGSGVLSLRHFGLVLLIPWRVGAEGIWRGVVLVYWFRRRDAARGAGAVQAARWRGRRRRRREFRFIDFRPPRSPPLSPTRAREGADGQAVVCPLLRGRSPTRGVAPKQHWACINLHYHPFARESVVLGKTVD